MIYVPLWLKVSLLWKQKTFFSRQNCYFCAVYQGPSAKEERSASLFNYIKKQRQKKKKTQKNNPPNYTNRKAKKKIYCIVSKVLTLHYKEWEAI